MQKIGFDAQKYIQMQYEHIVERINEGHGERLYLEFEMLIFSARFKICLL